MRDDLREQLENFAVNYTDSETPLPDLLTLYCAIRCIAGTEKFENVPSAHVNRYFPNLAPGAQV